MAEFSFKIVVALKPAYLSTKRIERKKVNSTKKLRKSDDNKTDKATA
jgi:hypothetical protein